MSFFSCSVYVRLLRDSFLVVVVAVLVMDVCKPGSVGARWLVSQVSVTSV